MPCATLTISIGALAVHGNGKTITRVGWASGGSPGPADTDDALLREAVGQLRAYFERKLTRFDLPLEPAASPRGEVLRQAIAAIPYGDTASYGQIARVIGSAPRAMGQACARNPFAIVIPCHRVLAAGGALGHYSGGRGVETKLALLRLETPGFQIL